MLVLLSTALAADCRCDHTLSPPQAFLDGSDVAPGERICLSAGRYPRLKLKDLRGTAEAPITIENCGGAAEIGSEGSRYGMALDGCAHVVVSGGGDPAIRYGIVLDETDGVGLSFTKRSTAFTVSRVEITNSGFAGLVAKTDNAEGWVMSDVEIRDSYIHDVAAEGMYIGQTKSPAHTIEGLSIHHNLIVRTGWDLLQLAHATAGVEVAHNTLLHGGLLGRKRHDNGLQIGDNTTGHYHHNTLIHHHGNALIVLGSGDILIENNHIHSGGERAFFIDNRQHAGTAPVIIARNLILHRGPAFVDRNEVTPIHIEDNTLFALPERTASRMLAGLLALSVLAAGRGMHRRASGFRHPPGG